MPEVNYQNRMNRRQALKHITVFGGISLGGCTDVLGSRNSGTVLGRIEVINASSVRSKIRLLVDRDAGTEAESDDERLLDRTISLAALDAESEPAGKIIPPVWSETKGQYTVHALHYDESDNRETRTWEYTFTQEDYERYYGDRHEDPGCIGAIVKIGSPTDSEKGAIGISSTYMENPCGTADSQ